ncbi:polyhydroxyalkanoic acid system family protein [Lysobacter sp. N42]|jgi:putative polyhydroxyalkanoate system protein|uniref:polyhydroxyalkanoic acid system family protein n=1 Tax=Lysobacter sp. N42 TaxID=2545719 RepID=UPI001050DB14|nr:polyhydroxyalkanoic acid system family protein [Lysobacter sp. N42]TCZ88944.1 polyhydroxyalkanoic acid synthase [Lysobacter sp. N42]
MSDIDIRHPHSLPPQQAREAVQGLAEALAQRFGVHYAWRGDALDFKRSGVDGRVALEPGALHVTARLGFLLGAMKGTIEHEIRRVLEERFGRG